MLKKFWEFRENVRSLIPEDSRAREPYWFWAGIVSVLLLLLSSLAQVGIAAWRLFH